MKLAFNMKTHNILSIDKFKNNIGTNCRIMGIDPGVKNIGIAICDENQKIATPFMTLEKNKFVNLLREIKKSLIQIFIIISQMQLQTNLHCVDFKLLTFQRNVAKISECFVSLCG